MLPAIWTPPVLKRSVPHCPHPAQPNNDPSISNTNSPHEGGKKRRNHANEKNPFRPFRATHYFACHLIKQNKRDESLNPTSEFRNSEFRTALHSRTSGLSSSNSLRGFLYYCNNISPKIANPLTRLVLHKTQTHAPRVEAGGGVQSGAVILSEIRHRER